MRKREWLRALSVSHECILRAALPTDARGIAEVHVASWRTTYPGIIPDSVLSALSVDDHESRWHQNLSSPFRVRQVAVAEIAGSIGGFLSCGPARKEAEGSTSEITSIYLLRQFQRSGIGTKLMAIAARWLADAGFAHTHVWVAEANPMIAFYDRLGSQRVARKIETVSGVELPEICLRFDNLPALAAPVQPLPWVVPIQKNP